LVGRSTGKSYVTTFASSGAEAVEAALKHAGAEYTNRLDETKRSIREGGLRAQRVLAKSGPERTQQLLSSASQLFGDSVTTLDELCARLNAQADQLSAMAPLVWALKRGFHGKTTGALRLTHNSKFRAPWSFLGSAVFLDPEDEHAIARASSDAALPYFVLICGVDGSISFEQRVLYRVMACFVEPIRGEGGIWELRPELARSLRAAADTLGFPLVFDEIQSGMGRTGALLASESLGVAGDYYLFSKSLGGGLAKISAMMVEKSRYIDEFGYLHTSTFAEDDWSCEVALATLELLEQDGGRFYQTCLEKGAYFRRRLESIALKFPRTVRDVRGRGLLLGLDLDTKRAWKSRLIRVLMEQDLLGFMIAGYLLREKHVRIAPALSANSTLRLEPSVYITFEEIDRACSAIEDVVALLDADDAREFARFLVLGARRDASEHRSSPLSRDAAFVAAAP
jgi:acetylornithine/succinyldiaminopimelate/putrescine aminotransferase